MHSQRVAAGEGSTTVGTRVVPLSGVTRVVASEGGGAEKGGRTAVTLHVGLAEEEHMLTV